MATDQIRKHLILSVEIVIRPRCGPRVRKESLNLHGTREFYRLTGALPECSKASIEVSRERMTSVTREMEEIRRC